MTTDMQLTHNEKPAVSCAIFAGGRNRRMGRHKAFLPLGGKTFLEHIITYTASWFEERFIVTNDKSLFPGIAVPVFEDIIPGKGPLSALHTALTVAKNSNVFCVACDMPFSSPELVEKLISASRQEEYDCFIPLGAGGPEPLFAIYRPTMLALLEDKLTSGQLSIRGAIAQCRCRFITLGDRTPELVNINTPQEYVQYADKI